MEISGTTKLFCLIGSPVAHSGSPAMHNFSFEHLGLDCRYLAFDIGKERIADAVSAIRTLPIHGCNVTMPCKTAILPYLDELSPAARLVGAVNTVVNQNGKLVGHITDGVGFVNSLRAKGVEVAGKRMTIFGSGGAATAIQIQCALDGAEQITIFCREDSFLPQAQRTVQTIQEHVPSCRIELFDLTETEQLARSLAESHILANATKVGMAPLEQESLVPDAGWFHSGLIVTDAVYHPKETKMLREAKAKGCKVIGGLGMLLWQGAEAFRLFTGKEMPVKEVYEKYFQ